MPRIPPRSGPGSAPSLAAVYDLTTGQLSFASAGHPGPVVRFTNGRVVECTGSGIMLGVGDDEPYALHAAAVGTDVAIVFYTDGLVEATRDPGAGQERLRTALASAEIVRGPAPARAIVERVLDGAAARDDIAVLVVRAVAQ